MSTTTAWTEQTVRKLIADLRFGRAHDWTDEEMAAAWETTPARIRRWTDVIDDADRAKAARTARSHLDAGVAELERVLASNRLDRQLEQLGYPVRRTPRRPNAAPPTRRRRARNSTDPSRRMRALPRR